MIACFCIFFRGVNLPEQFKGYPDLGLWRFNWECPHKLVLLTCSCAFRLCKLSQAEAGCRGLGLRHFTWEFSHKMVLVIHLWHVHLPFDCTGPRKVCAAGLTSSWPAAFSLPVLLGILCSSGRLGLCMSLHDPAQVRNRRSCGDPVAILLISSLHRCLYGSSSGMLIRCSCMKILWAPFCRST